MSFNYTKRPDGTLMKTIQVDGKRKYIYAKDPKELEQKYIDYKYLANKNIYINDDNLTVEKWANKWLDLYKSDKESATQKMYKDVIRLYIIPEIGYIKLKNLKEANITAMLNNMAKKGITRRRDVALLTVKQILDKAVDNDYIYKNVARGVKITKHVAKEKRQLSSEEIELINNLSKNDIDVFMIKFLLYTGLRKEEIVPLKWKDIDFENNTIAINKAVVFEKNQPIVKKVKNRKPRIVPIPNLLLDELKSLKSNSGANMYVFSKKDKLMMTETSLRRKLEHVLKKLNNEKNEQKNNKEKSKEENNHEELKKKEIEKQIEPIKFTYHQLRHTYACFLHKAGIDIKEAQLLMGHKDVKVLLNIYTHLDEEDKSIAIEKLNNFTTTLTTTHLR